MWKDGGHASANIVATDDGRVADLNASNIGNRIRAAQYEGRRLSAPNQRHEVVHWKVRSGRRWRRSRHQQTHHGCQNLLSQRTGLYLRLTAVVVAGGLVRTFTRLISEDRETCHLLFNGLREYWRQPF